MTVVKATYPYMVIRVCNKVMMLTLLPDLLLWNLNCRSFKHVLIS